MAIRHWERVKERVMKVSIVIPVYFNEDNLRPLYADIKEKFINKIDYEYEIVMVNDGSKDKSYQVMQELASLDSNITIISLAKNFGSHAACLCGLAHSTGDCAIIKAADLQEPTEMIHDMVASWVSGNNVVLACRQGREEKISQIGFANLYYWMVRKTALPTMPKGGFDCYLVDRKVIDVISKLDERNSALTGQILWSGFKTGVVFYTRKAREIGTSKWTLKKKIRLVSDTLFSFSTVPIRVLEIVGFLSVLVGIIWGIDTLIDKLAGNIPVSGFTTLFLFNIISFGIIMMSMGILGEYLWRTFDASRNRPPYIIEEDNFRSHTSNLKKEEK
jgi:dolichol-phosphate mannosyltransferase